MKITGIRQQERLKDRFSIYVDGAYAFSLGDRALLESNIAVGQELTGEDVARYKQLSAEDKLLNNAIRYAATRSRSRWELETYLQRKQAAPELASQIIGRLASLGLADDRQFARSWVENRRLLKPTSKRKLQQELRAKHVDGDIIASILQADTANDRDELRALAQKKLRQAKYRDDKTKLMQYLARQGFGYEDIKAVLDELPEPGGPPA